METSKSEKSRFPFIVNLNTNQIPKYEDEVISASAISAERLMLNSNFGEPIKNTFYIDLKTKQMNSKQEIVIPANSNSVLICI